MGCGGGQTRVRVNHDVVDHQPPGRGRALQTAVGRREPGEDQVVPLSPQMVGLRFAAAARAVRSPGRARLTGEAGPGRARRRTWAVSRRLASRGGAGGGTPGCPPHERRRPPTSSTSCSPWLITPAALGHRRWPVSRPQVLGGDERPRPTGRSSTRSPAPVAGTASTPDRRRHRAIKGDAGSYDPNWGQSVIHPGRDEAEAPASSHLPATYNVHW